MAASPEDYNHEAMGECPEQDVKHEKSISDVVKSYSLLGGVVVFIMFNLCEPKEDKASKVQYGCSNEGDVVASH